MKALTLTLLGSLALLNACTPDAESPLPGFVEGDWHYLAAPSAGWLEQLTVEEGDQLDAGALVFRLDSDFQELQVAQAEARRRQAVERREDLRTGARPQELAAIEAELEEARANLKLAAIERNRWLKLAAEGLASADTADQVTQRWEAAKARVRTAEAKLASARLGARPHQQVAAEAEAEASAQESAMAQWQVGQRTVASRASGRVERIFFRPGEFVPAGSPVLAILPPEAIKIRFYIPEPQLARFGRGQEVIIHRDGAPPVKARLTFIASEAEYTPPVIYSIENSKKLVFMAEARPLDPATAVALHPGQPVTVTLP